MGLRSQSCRPRQLKMYALLVLLVLVPLARGGGGGGGGGGGRGGRGGGGGRGSGAGKSIAAGKGIGKGGKGLSAKSRAFANSRATKAADRSYARITNSRLNPGQRAIIQQHKGAFQKYHTQILDKGPMSRPAHDNFWTKEMGASKFHAVEPQLKNMHNIESRNWYRDFREIYKTAQRAARLAEEEDEG